MRYTLTSTVDIVFENKNLMESESCIRISQICKLNSVVYNFVITVLLYFVYFFKRKVYCHVLDQPFLETIMLFPKYFDNLLKIKIDLIVMNDLDHR